MTYHLARAAFWMQQQAVAYVPDSPFAAINAYPPNAEIGALFTMLLSDGDRYVGLVQYAALFGDRDRDLRHLESCRLQSAGGALRALVLLTTPVVVLQGSAALNDLVVASFLGAATYFFLGETRQEFGLGGLALALAVGTKFTALIALPLVALVVLAGQPRRQWQRLVVAGVAGVALGSYWLVVNLVATGSLDGGAREQLGQDPDRSFQAVLARRRGCSSTSRTAWTWEGDALLYALSAVAFALRPVRRRGGGGADHGCPLAAFGAVACLPLAVPLVREGTCSEARREACGWRSTSPSSRFSTRTGQAGHPATSSPTTVRRGSCSSSPASLPRSSGGATPRASPGDRRTGRVRRSRFAVLLAVAIEYDPYRGRFLLDSPWRSPAATWGVVLGRRWGSRGRWCPWRP